MYTGADVLLRKTIGRYICPFYSTAVSGPTFVIAGPLRTAVDPNQRIMSGAALCVLCPVMHMGPGSCRQPGDIERAAAPAARVRMGVRHVSCIYLSCVIYAVFGNSIGQYVNSK